MMVRWLLPLILLAGCGGSSKSKNDMAATPADMATLACPETVDAYCTPSAGCVRDAASAQGLSTFCVDGGTEISAQSLSCTDGDLIVIVQFSDSATTFYYKGGTLTAVFTAVPHTQELVCLAGPANVVPPTGCGIPDNLCQP